MQRSGLGLGHLHKLVGYLIIGLRNLFSIVHHCHYLSLCLRESWLRAKSHQICRVHQHLLQINSSVPWILNTTQEAWEVERGLKLTHDIPHWRAVLNLGRPNLMEVIWRIRVSQALKLRDLLFYLWNLEIFKLIFFLLVLDLHSFLWNCEIRNDIWWLTFYKGFWHLIRILTRLGLVMVR